MSEKSKQLYENVATGILNIISSDSSLTVGSKIPTELELAEIFHVSRNTVRDAVRYLIIHGILEIRRGKGTFIVSDNFSQRSTPIITNLTDVKVQIKDLFETRLAIEPQIAYYAAKRATDKELEFIGKCIDIIEKDIYDKDADRFTQEAAFHSAIVRAAKNEFMMKLIPVIEECVFKAIEFQYNEKVIMDSSIQDHRIIYEFLLKHDPQQAKNAMSSHIARCMYQMNIAVD